MYYLQSLCLDIIVKNFQRFHFASTASKDAELHRNLQFLQKRFSNYLAEELLVNRENTEAYFDFLINQHLTSVDFRWFENSCYLKSIDDIFYRLPNLRRIILGADADESLKSIAKFCSKITEIDASDADFTDKGIQHLCETKNGKLPCPELKNVAMCDSISSITDEGAECLIRNLPSIEKFNYPYLSRVLHSIHTRNSTEPQKIDSFNLTDLDFSACENLPNFTEIIKTCVSVCPKLKSIKCCFSEEKELDALANSQPKRLHLFYKHPYINIDNCLKNCGRNVIELRIAFCTFSLSALAAHCPALQTLCLGRFNVDFTDDDDNNHALQPVFPSLTVCALITDNSIIDKTFRLLSSSSPKLKLVVFVTCILTGELKNDILLWCKSPVAERIVFSEMQLEISFLRDIILTCRTLEDIGLYCCSYDVDNPEETLNVIAKEHPKKPIVIFTAENTTEFLLNHTRKVKRMSL